ncbi:MAG: hypothetical protein SH847_13930, partial [Roseiflexaceae bacterium]|nr:hypothetical protein [Roseiflexaceae bacterium]
ERGERRGDGMSHKNAILWLLIILIACGLAGWAIVRRATLTFVAPGAADIRVRDVAPGERTITYQMPNPSDGWQTVIARRLSVSGWTLATDYYQWGDTEKYKTIYVRNSQIWLLHMCERAELLGDRSNAVINLRYRVACQ